MVLSDFHGALDLRLFQVLNQDGGPLLDTVMRALSTRIFGIGFGVLLAAILLARLGRGAARPLLALALAIQKRSSEVWQVLGAVKAEFGKFGEVLAAVEKKLVEASHKLGAVGTRSRAIERQLRGVQELPAAEAQAVLLQEAALDVSPEDGA